MEGFNNNNPISTAASNMSVPYDYYLTPPPTSNITTTTCTAPTTHHLNTCGGHEHLHHLPSVISTACSPFISTTTAAAIGTSTTSSSINPWMDSRIWSNLPRGLIDRIVAFLPPQAFFRARCVCKRWYGLLYSTNFLQLYLRITPRRQHWFLFFRQKTPPKIYNVYRSSSSSSSSNNDDHASSVARNRSFDNDDDNNSTNYNSRDLQEAYLFDPYELAWYRLSFPLIPPGFSPASSSGGLICWISDEPGPKSLFLHNPLVGATSSPISITQLPAPTLRPRLFPSVGMTTTSPAPSTNLLVNVTVIGDDMISPYAVKNISSESFHVDAAGGFYSVWGTTSMLPRLCSLEPSGRMTAADGKYFCMNYSPFSVLAYDVGTNIWYKIQAPMRRFLRSPSLVESYGRLILVAAVEKSKLNVPKSLRLWCLQQQSSGAIGGGPICSSSSSWVEIERMPQQLYMQFSEVEDGRGFDCVGHGEFIIIMIRGGGGYRNYNKGLLFDMMSKRWIWMPPCPYNHYSINHHHHHHVGMTDTNQPVDQQHAAHELHGFAYEPKLATPVTALLDQLASSFPPN